MANILDRILNIRPRGLAPIPDNPARVDDGLPFRTSLAGIDAPALIHPTNPYRPSPTGGAFPAVNLVGRMVPPNRRARHPSAIIASPGIDVSHFAGIGVKAGVHPGRRLGRTGNPDKKVGS